MRLDVCVTFLSDFQVLESHLLLDCVAIYLYFSTSFYDIRNKGFRIKFSNTMVYHQN